MNNITIAYLAFFSSGPLEGRHWRDTKSFASEDQVKKWIEEVNDQNKKGQSDFRVVASSREWEGISCQD